MDRETFRIQHRHLSEDDWREQYADQQGVDRHDLDAEIWRERERRNDRYREIDGA